MAVRDATHPANAQRGMDITISSLSSPELASALMQKRMDVALLRRETQTSGLAFKLLIKEPLVVILPANHRLAKHRTIRPQELARESFIAGSTKLAPVLSPQSRSMQQGPESHLNQKYDAENISGGMSLVASTGSVTLLPLYVTNMLIPSVVARPLEGEPPTIDLVMGYNKSNTSPLLMRFLSRADELVSRVSQKQGSLQS